MILLQKTHQSPLAACHYLPNEQWQFDYFFATDLSASELDAYLEQGWRKFGFYFFRPVCPTCRQCIPIRVPTAGYHLTRSQKRVARKNRDIRVRFGPPVFSDRIFQIYCDHSATRFDKRDNHPADFFSSFYSPSCPVLQSEYYLDEILVGVGFLDCST